MVARTTVRLPEELLKRAKRKAAVEGRTLASLIEDGLRLVVAEKRKRSKSKPILPRVSKASGGLMPGIDLNSLSKFEEMDDVDYARRMKRLK
jgi:hypothetical protein